MPLTTPRLRELRRQRPLTIRELSELADVGTATIARLERGCEATPKTVRKLADTLGVEPEYLMGGVALPAMREKMQAVRSKVDLLSDLKRIESEMRSLGIRPSPDDDDELPIRRVKGASPRP